LLKDQNRSEISKFTHSFRSKNINLCAIVKENNRKMSFELNKDINPKIVAILRLFRMTL
jgi:hypothetical protein